MPQFDTSFFAGQIFWMLFSFGLLYLMMSQLVCPMIEEVLSARSGQIQADLDKAESLNRQAEILHQRYQTYILNTEKEKSERIQEAYARIQKSAAAIENRNDAQLRRKIRQTEKKIEQASAVLRHESEELSSKLADAFSKRLSDLEESV